MKRPRRARSLGSALSLFSLSLACVLGACQRPREPFSLPPQPAASITLRGLAEPPPGALEMDSTAFGRIDADVSFFSSPELGGRATGEPGARAAAETIRSRYQRLGLRPAGDPVESRAARTSGEEPTASYFQRLDATVGALALPSIVADDTPKAKPVASVTADGASDGSVRAPLVFVGYGMTVPSLSWDDYDGKSIEGKIAVVLAGKPPVSEADPKLAGLRDFGSDRYKIKNAREHKAAGVILIADRKDLPAAPTEPTGMGLPAAVITRDTASRFFRGIDVKKNTLWDAKTAQAPIDLGKKAVQLTTRIQPKTVQAWNVLAALPARARSANASEWVVVSAHYDHLGMGGPRSRAPGKREIHPGADDNASGTALLLEVAYRLSRLPDRPMRNVLFAAWGAEEIGLLGSRWFLDHPTVPSAKIVAMINADMVGRLRERQLLVDATSTSDEWPSLVKAAATGLRLQVTLGTEGYGASDHANFAAAKVPVAFLFTGSHADYHLPTDTADKVNTEGISVISVLAARLARSVADKPSRLAFVEPPGDPHRGVRGLNVSLGTVPDYAFEGEGVRLAGVRPDSPASRAGLVAGDVLVLIGAREITRIQSYMAALRELEPGRETSLEIKRGAQRLTVKILPAPAQGGEPHPRKELDPSPSEP